MRGIADGYIAGDPALEPFFSAAPNSLFADAPPSTPWKPEIAAAPLLWRREEGRWRNVSPDPESTVIITGQQPGLLTGPLYTIYKAVTTIILARRLESIHGRPFLPVFWVAGDDHDFEETRRVTLLTQDHTPYTLEYQPESDVTGLPMRRVPVEACLHDLVDSAATHAAGGEPRERVRAELRDALNEAGSFSDWFANIMGRLFEGTPLCFFTPGHEADRKTAEPIIQADIESPGTINSLLTEASAELAGAGYAAPLEKRPEECNFFLELDEKRRKTVYENGAFALPEDGVRMSRQEMLERLASEPHRFTPNVVLRCVVQQALFPVAAYVAGPGEVAYWAQFKRVFEWLGQPMPVVYPRASAALGSTKVWRLLARYNMALDQLGDAKEALLDRALAHINRKAPLREAVSQHRARIREELTTLEASLRGEHPPAGDMADALLRSASRYLDRIEGEVLRADKRQVDTVEEHIAKLQNCFQPWRRPQERVYTVFSFLFSHGFPLIQRLLAEMEIGSNQINEIEL